ncbi:hypothetical protein ACIGEP_13385 [Microbacterium sp. NPDC077663]|uniref:hypothetical protein n=1 Tax=Microbacterium sp. NPDC077663 TaxID=3364189 RepID=UPI0037C5EC86
MADSFEVLTSKLMAVSVSTDLASAISEWEVVALEEDPSRDNFCVCGQPELAKLFTIRNSRNGEVMYPIGSECVKKFGSKDLDAQVNLYADLLKLRIAVQKVATIEMTSEFFSRAVLEYLYEEGAFTPDQYNGQDGEMDLIFLLKMFNMRYKDRITGPQRRKIRMLMSNKMEPFILNDRRLKSPEPEAATEPGLAAGAADGI